MKSLHWPACTSEVFDSSLNINIVLEFPMSSGDVLQSFGAATSKAREAEDDFVRGTTCECSSADRKDHVGSYGYVIFVLQRVLSDPTSFQDWRR